MSVTASDVELVVDGTRTVDEIELAYSELIFARTQKLIEALRARSAARRGSSRA